MDAYTFYTFLAQFCTELSQQFPILLPYLEEAGVNSASILTLTESFNRYTTLVRSAINGISLFPVLSIFTSSDRAVLVKIFEVKIARTMEPEMKLANLRELTDAKLREHVLNIYNKLAKYGTPTDHINRLLTVLDFALDKSDAELREIATCAGAYTVFEFSYRMHQSLEMVSKTSQYTAIVGDESCIDFVNTYFTTVRNMYNTPKLGKVLIACQTSSYECVVALSAIMKPGKWVGDRLYMLLR